MSSGTVELHNFPCEASKQAKINIELDHNISDSTENCSWINHEVIIDNVIIEQPSETDIILSDDYNRISENSIQLSDHDYGFANLNSAGIKSITLRQDLFPNELNKRTRKILTIPAKNMSQSSRVKSVRNSSFKFILPKKRRCKLATAINSKRKLKSKILVQKQATESKDTSDSSKDPVIDLTDDSNVLDQSSSSQFPVLLKKVDPKEVPLEIKEARNLLKSNMNISTTCKVNQVVLNHAISIGKQDAVLQMVEPNKFPTGTKSVSNKSLVLNKRSKDLSRERSIRPGPYLRSNLKKKEIMKQKEEGGISKESSTNQAQYLRSNVKKKEILKPKERSTLFTESVTKIVPQEKVKENFVGQPNLQQKLPVGKILEGYLSTPVIKSNTQKTPLLLKKVNSNEVPQEIKNSVPLLKMNTAPNLHPQYSNINISGNSKDVEELDISEVRLSSLANASQVSTVGSTTETSTVSGEGIMKPSTSNDIGVADNNAVKVLNSESPLNDLTKELSDDESDGDEELGLNSLEELQQFWQFLVELHDYNKQVIRSLQNKKRRYILSIQKLERHLKEDLGLIFDEVEEKEDESSEVLTKEVEPTTEEEKTEEQKKNQPMEE